jgi:ApaG protein
METKITHGVRVSVESKFEPQHSRPQGDTFVFSYTITIENCRPDTVQLLHRHWYILNGVGQIDEVQGPGVIGEQPVLEPGQTYQYQSWCPLSTEMGKMWGSYHFIRPADKMNFAVAIPAFQLVPPYKAN